MTARTYRPETDTTGWLVRCTRPFARNDGTTVESVSWWYGPDHGWGTTSGPLVATVPSYSQAVWYPTKTAALAALRTVYGSNAGRARGYQPIRVEDVR